ncbi:hypothetical protein [Paenibacillus dendritiformis]|uniref:Uncharacterized protein n=1 Tax=Paenibacillus dendritiformis C454 TaxID=1131935 RepID=H3SFG8_9BACL|nr:hypothetical protein [Paenibacillus dendritiformis]EHQ62197.1 hypothetical protein PDENDC454_11365 [Paenibacillus dendritiformis C454]CAH8771555.1 hypothetical protein H7S4_004290 [Paenibacillus dendritiformis]
MKQAVIELDLGYEIIHLNGYLVADDYLVAIENNVMWMYHVCKKDEGDVYTSTKAGLWLGLLKRKEADEQALILRVLDFLRNLTFYDFLRDHHDWTMDYNFQFVEAVTY